MKLQSLSTLALATTFALVTSGCGPSPNAGGAANRNTRAPGAPPAAGPANATKSDPSERGKVSTRAIESAIRASGPGFDTGNPSTADSSSSGAPTSRPAETMRGFAGTVSETMNASSYTYVKVSNGEQSIWAATLQFPVEVGERVVVPVGKPMVNFHSNALGRTFESIYFCDTIGRPDRAGASGASPQRTAATPTATPPAEVSAAVQVEKAEGGLTIAEIFDAPHTRVGKEVLIRGRVVKYNSAILGRNWLHIQDGTGTTGTNDLTVTTTGTARVGDTVLIRGVVAVDKDFGAGYRYPLIIENAQVTVE